MGIEGTDKSWCAWTSDGRHRIDYTGLPPNRDTRVVIKLDADAVLGVHALAMGGRDLILTGVYTIKFGLTVDELMGTCSGMIEGFQGG